MKRDETMKDQNMIIEQFDQSPFTPVSMSHAIMILVYHRLHEI